MKRKMQGTKRKKMSGSLDKTKKEKGSLLDELHEQGITLVAHLILEYACPVFTCLKPTNPTYEVVERGRMIDPDEFPFTPWSDFASGLQCK